MSGELTKKAVEMLLKGATLLGEPCPYCKGVRVMKDGHALCVSCGKEPKEKTEPVLETKSEKSESSLTLQTLEQKLQDLSEELANEKDHQKQQDILNSINSLIQTIDNLKKLGS